MAARGAGAAAGDAGDRLPQQRSAARPASHGGFRKGLDETGYAKGATSPSSTASRIINTIGCRRWRPIWFAREVAVIDAQEHAGAPSPPKRRPRPFRSSSAWAPIRSRIGLVTSLNHPGGNVTGISSFNRVAAKRLGLMLELLPNVERVAVLVNPTNPNCANADRDAQAAARSVGRRKFSSAQHRARDRRRVRDARAAARRRPRRQPRSVLHRSPSTVSRWRHIDGFRAIYSFRELRQTAGS